MPEQVPPSFRERAIRMVTDGMEAADGLTQCQVIKEVTPKLNVSKDSLRHWAEEAEVDAGTRPGRSSDAEAEIRSLKRVSTELRRANKILKKTASTFFAAEFDCLSTK